MDTNIIDDLNKLEELKKILSSFNSGVTIELSKALEKEQTVQKQKILNEHHYWQSKSDDRWRTHIIINEKRKLVVKTKKEDIEKVILDYYLKKESTFNSLYKEFMEYKKETVSPNTIKEYVKSFNKYYKNDSLMDKPLKELTAIDVEKWVCKNIREYGLNKKSGHKMQVVFFELLRYAYRNRITEKDIVKDIKINQNLYTATITKDDQEEVFLIEEQEEIERLGWDDFNNKPYAVPLAVLFTFQTGLRISEVCVLKWEDVQGNYLKVRRYERPIQKTSEDLTSLEKCGFEIVDNTKGHFGERKVYLTSKAKEILETVKEFNKTRGYSSPYIFENDRGHIHHRGLDRRIRKYCNQIGICEKSMHKIRKTYISTLIDNDVNINTIRQTVGHKDCRTTYKNYCRNRRSVEQTEQQFETALCG